MPFSRRHHFLPLLPLLLLASSCQKPSAVHAQEEQQQQQQQQHSHRLDDEAIQTQFNPQVETVPLPKPSQQQEAEGSAERERREAPAGPASGGGGNNNVYWLAADGPDFQLWQPAMGAAYGSNGQQQQAAAMQMSSQPQQPNVAATTAQQQQQQVAAAAVQQQMAAVQQQQQTASSNQQQQQQQQQQMMPQQNYQQSMGGMGFQSAGGYGQYGGQQGGASPSPYAAYLEKQISSYPVMIYTLADCIPCQRAKHMLAVHYPDVRAHYLELSGNEPWQQQLQVDLQYMTGAITFPYIFVCGQYIGGSTELFELHESGQLRRLVSQCLQKQQPPK